jgi:hypothetical protein
MASWLSSLLASVGLQRISTPPTLTRDLTGYGSEAKQIEHISDVAYPPRDPGLPIKPAEQLVQDHVDVLEMLRLHAAETPDRFEQRFLAPITRLAELVNTLPATPDASFSGAGGLFRACMETGFHAFRASDGRIFTGAQGVEARHRLEGRWRYVCFTAGLIYPLGTSLCSMAVIDTRGRKWSPELESVLEWARQNQSDRVFASWVTNAVAPGPAPVSATFALKVLGRVNVEWLNEGSAELVSTLLDIVTVGGGVQKDGVASSLVREIWVAVQERETARRYQNYGRLTIGSHVSPYLLDAVVALAKAKWKFQESVMFADTTGVYLHWPLAGEDIISYCAERGYTGIPSSEQALLTLMVSNGLVTSGVDRIALLEIAGPEGEVVMGVKLTHPELVVPDDTTLEQIAGERKVSMSLVRASDPLTRAQNALKTTVSQPAATQAATAPNSTPPVAPSEAPIGVPAPASSLRFDEISPLEILGSPDSGSEQEQEQEGTGAEPVKLAALPATQQDTTGELSRSGQGASRSARQQEPGAIVEAPEIKYSELLPEDVASKFRNVDAELLGRLVHVWRRKAADGRVMRVCEHGIAFELDLLADYTQDPAGFLSHLGAQGFLFSERTTPGKMIYQVAATEGSRKTATCFIILHHAAKKLGMP